MPIRLVNFGQFWTDLDKYFGILGRLISLVPEFYRGICLKAILRRAFRPWARAPWPPALTARFPWLRREQPARLLSEIFHLGQHAGENRSPASPRRRPRATERRAPWSLAALLAYCPTDSLVHCPTALQIYCLPGSLTVLTD